LRPDERAAADALAAEVGCSRTDLIRVALRWLYGRHPGEIRRRLADLPRDGRGVNRAGPGAARWTDEPLNEASRPGSNGTAREKSLVRSDRGEPTPPIA